VSIASGPASLRAAMVPISPVANKLRNAKRFALIVEVLARHGFGSFLQDSGLDRVVQRGRELIFRAAPRDESTRLPEAVRLRLVLEELGPTFIKLGQVLSTRPDLIPPEVAKEFEKLQSDVPAVPYEQIRGRLVSEFGDSLDELFLEIDEEPLAAASMAQVHRARLADGTPVVLKVIRPGTRNLVEADVQVLSDLARFVEKHLGERGFHPTSVVREFSRQLKKELDLVNEGKATERLQRFFEDRPEIAFPKVYWEATTRSVLALEEIRGTLLSHLEPETLTEEERVAIARNGTDAVFRMCLELGFFHADPHPGNIFALPGGDICFIDCGMTGSIEEHTARDLLDLVAAVVKGDVSKVVRLMLALTDADPMLEEDRTLRVDTRDLVAKFQDDKLGGFDVGGMLQGLFEILREHHIQCPGDLVFLIKALTTIQGVGARIAPEFDIVAHLQPQITQLVKQRYGPRAMRIRFQRSLMGYVELAEELPYQLRMMASQVRRRDFSIKLQHKGLDELKETIAFSSRVLSLSVVIAASIIGSAIMIHADSGAQRWGLFAKIGIWSLIATLGFATTLLISVLRRKS
jgi:ubiquinone biosynthesis protein